MAQHTSPRMTLQSIISDNPPPPAPTMPQDNATDHTKVSPQQAHSPPQPPNYAPAVSPANQLPGISSIQHQVGSFPSAQPQFQRPYPQTGALPPPSQIAQGYGQPQPTYHYPPQQQQQHQGPPPNPYGNPMHHPQQPQQFPLQQQQQQQYMQRPPQSQPQAQAPPPRPPVAAPKQPSPPTTIPQNQIPPGGAPARRYLNENVTPVLLEGMKMLAREQPKEPLLALARFLEEQHKKASEGDVQMEDVNGS